MVYKIKPSEPPLLYEENSRSERKRRYCLKPIKLIESKAAKDEASVNILFNRGTKTSINIDNMEERKIQEHFNFVTAKLEKLHKNLMWNMFIGRSYLDRNEKVSRVMDEVSLDSSEVGDFDVGNPKTWSKESLNQIEATLQVNEIQYDGIVSVFSVNNDANDRDIDSDEVAWELEKVLVYHCINSHPQRLLNQEAVLARQGLDPISRKVRTPGRNRAGYVVFLSYQLVESITFSQVMLDSVFYSVDIEMKKKQLLHQLGDLKLSPAVDDKVRKQIKDIKEFLGKEQVEILHHVKELKDPEKLSVILQFIQLIHAGDNQRNMAGINQFVSFLSEKEEMKRKQSSSSFSSCSTSSELQSLPITKRMVSTSSTTSLNNNSPRLIKTPRKSSSRQTELADIQSDVESDQPQPLPEPQPSEVRRPGLSQTRRTRPVSAGTSEERRVKNSVSVSRLVKDSTTTTRPATSSPRLRKRNSLNN